MDLLRLPTELLVQIVNYSRPEGFENLARTCKLLLDIARPLFENHRRLKQLYSSEDLGIKSASGRSCHELLYDALIDPLAARYPKRLRCCEHEWRPCSKEMQGCDAVRRFIQQSTYVKRVLAPGSSEYLEQYLETWSKEVKLGNPHFVASALLLLLPNLEDITLCLDDFYREHLDNVMHEVACDAVAGSRHPLSQLHTVRIEEWGNDPDDEEGTPMQTLASFLALPSIRKVSGRGLKLNSDRYDYWWPVDRQQSNVKELELSDMTVDSVQLGNLLQPMHQLRIFKYSSVQCDMHIWNARDMLRALVRCVGSTLEELSLTNLYPSNMVINSFHGFTKLKRLEFATSMLYRDVKSCNQYIVNDFHVDFEDCQGTKRGPKNILDIVPASVEHITLKCDSDDIRFNWLFDEFVENYRKALPKLTEIVFKHHWYGGWSDYKFEFVKELQLTELKIVMCPL